MSIRDSASGSSDWHGGGGSFNNGGGGAQNGGVGGGRGGGGYGGGAGYNGGLQSRQGLQTGNTIYGNTAFGRPSGIAQGYAMRDPRSLNAAGMGPSIGAYGNFMDRQGNPMFSGALGGSSFYGRNAQQALSQAQRAAMNRPNVGIPQPASSPITQQPLPPIQPPVPPVKAPLTKAMLPGFFNAIPPAAYPAYNFINRPMFNPAYNPNLMNPEGISALYKQGPAVPDNVGNGPVYNPTANDKFYSGVGRMY